MKAALTLLTEDAAPATVERAAEKKRAQAQSFDCSKK
jgi:hypothetical protein